MSKEKLAITFLLVIIAFIGYMIATLVYHESFRQKKEIKFLEISLQKEL